MKQTPCLKLLTVIMALASAVAPTAQAFDVTQLPREDWPTYGGSFSHQRFSQLDQLTPENVDQLRVKWAFPTPDAGEPRTSFATTPLVVRGGDAGLAPVDVVMFVTFPRNRVVAPEGTPERTAPTQPLCGPGQQFVPFARPGAHGEDIVGGRGSAPIFTPPTRLGSVLEPGARGGS
jgi:hypothetical protein